MSPISKIWALGYQCARDHLGLQPGQVEIRTPVDWQVGEFKEWPGFRVVINVPLAMLPTEDVQTFIATLRILQNPSLPVWITAPDDFIEVSI